MKKSRLNCIAVIILIALGLFVFKQTNAQSLPTDVLSQLNGYNVKWDSPSLKGSAGSMPLGNGDITSNVWVDSNGDLMLYIGKSDCWSEGTRMLKVGRVRIGLNPNPFIAGKPFSQELNLYNGEVNISAGDAGSKINLKLWIDANNPVIHVEASGEQAFAMSCKTELLRPTDYTLPSKDDPIAPSFRGVTDGTIKPAESADVVLSKPDRIEWYHRNNTSLYPTILTKQNLQNYVNTFTDPYLNRTFGAAIKCSGLSKVDDYTLQSSTDLSNYSLSIYPLTAQTNTLEEWDNQLSALISSSELIPISSAYASHCDWWDKFWNRSWIFITGDADAIKVTQGYLLQRFMTACMGRGKYPIKFNGGSFTFDYLGKNGDFRQWGPGYWNQNVRCIYWPLLASGDFEMMMPWFDCYKNMTALQKAATSTYFNHGGAYFPETFNFFGLNILDDWGYNNTGTITDNPYIRYNYNGALEVISQMLDYYEYTNDETFVQNYIVPFASEAIRFYDQHWKRINGKIEFYPVNAMETFWDCTNPTDILAGLHYNLPRLCALSSSAVSQELKTEWTNCLNALPEITMDKNNLVINAAEMFGTANNSENPECYAIFPYKLHTIGSESVDVGINTFAMRRVPAATCWGQDPVQAPLVGLTDLAQKSIIANAKSVDTNVKFPAFWAPRNDYMPDFDNGGNLMMGLQNMLVQNVENQILVLPSWPANWNVDFKLLSPKNTSVRVKATGNTISQLDVLPSERSKDVVLPNGKQNQSIYLPPFPVKKPNTADLIPVKASSGLVATYTSSDTTVATIVNEKIHLVGEGTTLITAFQPGNDKYNPSPVVHQELMVSSSTLLKIEAESFKEQSGIIKDYCSEGGLALDSISNEDYSSYLSIKLTGLTNINFRVLSELPLESAAGRIEIRVDLVTGPLIGTLDIKGTGANWKTISCPVIKTNGSHTIYLLYKNNCNFKLNWLQTEISTATAISNVPETPEKWIIYPNPARETVFAEFDSKIEDSVTLSVFNANGGLTQQIKTLVHVGNNRIEINTKKLNSGIYFIKAELKNNFEVMKLIIEDF